MKFILLIILIKQGIRNLQNQYIALLDTDSEYKSNKINCTNNQLNNHYNHADLILDIIQNENILHFIIQDNNKLIKEEYITCALKQLLQEHIASIILIPINSYSGFSSRIYKLIRQIVLKFNTIIIIAKHPLKFDETTDLDNIIFIDRNNHYSSSENVALYGTKI